MSMVRIKCDDKVYKVGIRDFSKLVSAFGYGIVPPNPFAECGSVMLVSPSAKKTAVSEVMGMLKELTPNESVGIDSYVSHKFVTSVAEISDICATKKVLRDKIDNIIRTNRVCINEHDGGWDKLMAERMKEMRKLQEQVAEMNSVMERLMEKLQ